MTGNSQVPLVSLYQFRAYLGLDGDDGRDDERLWGALMGATAMLHERTGRTYHPHYATLTHDADARRPHRISLRHDALEVHHIEDAFGVVQGADVILTEAGIVRLTGARSFVWEGDGVGALAVTGIWGWHDAWGQAWRDSGEALISALDADADNFTVSDSTAPDGLHSAPRLQRGQLLALGTGATAEYVGILGIERETHRLLVVRGAHGTQARAHDADTPLRIYQAPYAMQQACLRMARWLYRASDGGVEDALPLDLHHDLMQWRRVRV